ATVLSFLVVLFFYFLHPLRPLHSFPTRRSSDLITTDHVGNFLKYTQVGAEICRLINSSRLNVLYDVYHMQLNEGCICDTITNYRSEEHTSELQSRFDLVCRLLLEKKNQPH